MSDLLDFSPPGQTTFTLSAARARFYDAGTTTLRTVYTDQSETVPHPSPLIADASGRWPQAFVSGGPVKVVVTQADESTGYTLDPCEKVAASGAGASAISFEPTVDLPFTNVQDAIEGAAASAATGFTPFGLGVTGSVALIANLNDAATASGQYRFDATTTGTFPTGVAAADTGAVRVERETSGSAWMWLYHDTTDRVFIRRMTSSVWGTWRENITVNQGAAEGDIIYRAASAWTRLPRGTNGQYQALVSGIPAWVDPPSPVKAWVNFNGTPQNGTYSRTGNTVTVTMTAHGMASGMVANLDFTTGAGTDGSYAVTVTDANTFTIADPASGATSGNVTRNNYIRASLNVTSITDGGLGRYTVNMTAAISDARYAALATAGDASEARLAAQTTDMTTTTFKIYVINHGNGVFTDAEFVSASVIR